MITLPTVLVLGAGASAAYGFPLGRKLLLQICDSLSNHEDVGLKKSLLDLGFGHDEITRFQSELWFSMQPSVDAFLEKRSEYMDIGKTAIVGSLIPYEDLSLLWKRYERLTWYEYLFNQMDASIDEFKSNQISFVTFNYDRSLEYFLYFALENTYGISEERVVELLGSIPIIHVYGQLGLPGYLSKNGIAYGQEATPEVIEKCVTEIKIISDLAGETEEFKQAHELINQAEILCFLGFGYHRTNALRLRVNENFRGGRLLGSVYKMGEDEIRRARHFFEPFSTATGRPIRLGNPHEDAITFIKNHPVFD